MWQQDFSSHSRLTSPKQVNPRKSRKVDKFRLEIDNVDPHSVEMLTRSSAQQNDALENQTKQNNESRY